MRDLNSCSSSFRAKIRVRVRDTQLKISVTQLTVTVTVTLTLTLTLIGPAAQDLSHPVTMDVRCASYGCHMDVR